MYYDLLTSMILAPCSIFSPITFSPIIFSHIFSGSHTYCCWLILIILTPSVVFGSHLYHLPQFIFTHILSGSLHHDYFHSLQIGLVYLVWLMLMYFSLILILAHLIIPGSKSYLICKKGICVIIGSYQ